MTNDIYNGAVIAQLNEMVIETEWSLDEWRGLLANAKEIDHQLDVEAEEAGRR